MGAIKNKGCLVEIILCVIIIAGIVTKFLCGNVKVHQMWKARSEGTIEAYQEIINKFHGSRYAREAADSLLCIYQRGDYSIKDLVGIRDEYKTKAGCFVLEKRLTQVVERRVDFLYDQALETNTNDSWESYCKTVPQEYWKDAKWRIIFLTPAYRKAAQTNTIAGWKQYISSVSPDDIADAENRLVSLCREEYVKAERTNTIAAWKDFMRIVPKEYWQDAEKQLEILLVEKYRNNQLPTGSKPWAKYYGYGPSSGWSSITVNASSSSDVVVVVKYDNSNGNVANHAYIRKGDRYTLYLPSGRLYQVFFYSGNGWNPEKQMKDKVKGGFISGSCSKDGTPYVLGFGVAYTYTLQETRFGNFKTQKSSEDEIL